MIIVGVDIETTGIKQEDGHRITEIAMDIYQYKNGVVESKGVFQTLVNPERSIPENIQNLTGITPALVANAPTWSEVAPKVERILSLADVFVAHNVDFDAPFLAMELLRVGCKIKDELELFCTMQEGRFATALGKVPKLSELCWAFEMDFDENAAHRADFDTRKMMDAFWKGVELGYFKLDKLEKVSLVAEVA